MWKGPRMSLFDCIARIMADDEASQAENAVKQARIRALGAQAQQRWKDTSALYERQGHPRHTAEAMAGEDVKAAFRKEAGDMRHVFQAKIANIRQLQAWAQKATGPDVLTRMEKTDMKTRAQVRRFNGLVGEYLNRHHRDLLGRVKHEAEQADILKELGGQSTGKPSSKALADAIRHAIEEMRLAANERGALIPKLENYDVPHKHNRRSIMAAKFPTWAARIDDRLDWSRIMDPLTGKPVQADVSGKPPQAFRTSFLQSTYDNIVFGREVNDPVYGRPDGVATYRKMAEQRVLHFKSADDWIAYNKEFGSGGFHASLMGHIHAMSRDIALMEDWGPNPKLGVRFYGDLLKQKFAGDEVITGKIETSIANGTRAMNVLSGGAMSGDPMTEWIGGFFSNARGLMTSAMLDRAIISSISDTNTMRMAATAMKMNPSSMMARQVGIFKALSPDELRRAGWIAETQADAGNALARFQQEVPSSELIERLASGSMRVQGLSWWTDRARAVAYQEWAGHLMNFADMPYASLDEPMRRVFDNWGVTADDWARFTAPETRFVADNGATFVMPIHWRNATGMDARKADDIFFKFQGAAEDFIELAVPTRSLAAQAFVDPSAFNLPPGTVGHELLKSAGQFKSFTMTFTVNQYRQIVQQGGIASKGGFGYAFNLAAGATVMGALALQAGEILMGRDPQDMTEPGFWGRATLKGGGFAILGDIIATGEASWGGGFASYLAGPTAQLVQDAWDLGPSNVFDAAGDVLRGEEVETGFAKDLSRLGKRYTPMGQTPIIGPAVDRNFWDQLQLMLDPESLNDLLDKAKNQANLTGGGTFWLPGSPLPTRAPDLGNVFGG
jgi:hypothetical protein